MNINCVIFEKRIECSKTCFSNSHFGASRAGKHKIQAEPLHGTKTRIGRRGEPLCSPENSAIFFYSADNLAKMRIAGRVFYRSVLR